MKDGDTDREHKNTLINNGAYVFHCSAYDTGR